MISKYIPLDKAYHMIAGMILYAGFHFINPLVALAIVALIAVIKEVYDKISKTGTPEYADILFTILGGLLGYICTL